MSKQSAKPSFPELRGSVDHIKYPAMGEVKYDGELCYIIYAGDKICTVNKYGTVREEWPAIDAIMDELKKNNLKAGIFISELYYGEGKLHSLYGLNGNKESDELKVSVFDIIQADEVLLTNESLLTRKEILHDCIGKHAIKVTMLKDRAAADTFFQDTLNAGFEGVVLKNLDSKLVMGPCDWAKMKGKDRTDYEVSTVAIDQERIEIIVPLAPPQIGNCFVGCKAPNKYKKHIQVGGMVTIEHQGVLPSGKLRHPVLIAKPEWK